MQFECNERKQEDSKKYQNYFERRGSNNKRFDPKKRVMLASDVIKDAVFGESSDAKQEEQHEAYETPPPSTQLSATTSSPTACLTCNFNLISILSDGAYE
ncbi:hypothetical protein ACLOJK_027036 [Asimina triloba]